ncbi:hypothetical protein K493DRAFT_316444 [Basidiobolus meristosporus CBS 931.73]|uniref:Uncharacterized protein n=1 Tax=Basidiobolus meristosporus CBS 931.73 TaxID=1314790 RepID=A0A1Y1Y3R0_9FUNG|nr:hypothetical protein K493DRAFT_316444 [Basidiobolus meristosporus CBS 931.73]|eukprot:ORX92672.1 hypothetical protein K493DRAFT_316444 [Basidiobolus meristosporus CBS 931.73]
MMITNDAPLKSAAIVNKLLALRPKPNVPRNETHKPITCLRVETSTVTKEVNKFRACDGYSCFYCREWAQLLQRKHFPSAARIRKESMLTINFAQPIPRERVSGFCSKLEQNVQAKLSKDSNFDNTIISYVADSVDAWLQRTPSTFETLNTKFAPINFDISPDNVPLTETKEDPVHILNKVEAEKFHLALTEEDFPLLRTMTPAVMASLVTPDCHHTRPDYSTLADLEASRRSINEVLEKVYKECGHDVEQAVDSLWSSTSQLLKEMKEFEAARVQAVADGCFAKSVEFSQTHQDLLIGFNEYWNTIVENHKKKSKKLFAKAVSSDQVDASFYDFLDRLKKSCDLWNSEFLASQVATVRRLVESISKACYSRINVTRDHLRFANTEDAALQLKLKSILTRLEEFSNRVEAGLSKLEAEFESRVAEISSEIEAIKGIWQTESQPTTQGRLEKAANKEFKKRIKRVESLASSTRSWSITHMKTLITPETLVELLIPTLEVQMMDTEYFETTTVENLLRNHSSVIEEVTSRREQVWEEFVRGVNVGRAVLGSVLGKLFLKEGLRQIEDRVAAHKEKWLLEQIEDEVVEVTEPKKKTRKSKKASSEVSSPTDEQKPEVNFVKAVNSSPVIGVPKLEVDIDSETVSTVSVDSMPHTPVDAKAQSSIHEAIKATENLPSLPEEVDRLLSEPSADSSVGELNSMSQAELINLVTSLRKENSSLTSTLAAIRSEFTSLSTQCTTLAQALRQQEEYVQVKEQEYLKSISLKESEMENARRYVAAMEQRITLLERDHPVNQPSNSRPSTPALVAEMSRLAYKPSTSNLRHEIELSDDEDFEIDRQEVPEQKAIEA